MALLRCTVRPLIRETSLEDFTISCVLIPVLKPPKASDRVFNAMTISSSAALPARSPMPLTVHSTCLAPASTAARELATAKPRSLWQWTLMMALPDRNSGTSACRWPIREPNSAGTAHPTVSGMLTVVAPASTTA